MQTGIIEISQKKKALWSTIASTGFAMFVMFFGAGNIVFPLALGQFAQDKNFFSVIGLLITAVIVPFIGLLGMLLYEGDYNKFFQRIGKVPGFILTLLILGLIGPLAGIPRCITISYSTLESFSFPLFSRLNLPTFSLLSCLVIFLFTFRPNRLLSLLGYVLTPALLLSLTFLFVKGFWMKPDAAHSTFTAWEGFSRGLLEGYNTMDLLAAFFFSSVVILCLRKRQFNDGIPLRENRRLLSVVLWSSGLAAFLLASVYIGFSYLAAGYSQELEGISGHQILGALALQVLGPQAGLITGLTVSFACLTTEIALTAVFAGFIHKVFFREKISYVYSVLITLFVGFFISTLNFNGISAFLVPILQIFYPALIVLALMCILHKVFNVQNVKRIFYSTVFLSFLAQIFIYCQTR